MPFPEKKPKSRTRLNEEEILRLIEVVHHYLKDNPAINNRTLRAISGINYDQAIHFFNHMVEAELLSREGKGSGIKYTQPTKSNEV
jgi:predicted HTH transcriptional regulator